MAQKLLLADDSVTIQRVIELTFADENIDVVAVSDGDQAIARLEADPPDIVLADIGMPGKTGYEVAAYVKGNPRLAHIPVVLLTGAFEPVDQVRAAQAGTDGVLAKPFEPQLVIARVRELLSQSAKPSAQLDARPAPPAVPPPSSGRAAPLDDYFDRLDQAFATMSPAQPPAPPSPPEPPGADLAVPDLDWFSTSAPAAAPVDLPISFASPAPSAPPAAPPPAPAAPEPAVPEPAVPPPVTYAAPSAPLPQVPPAAVPTLGDAFAAILAAEEADPSDAAATWPAAPPAADDLVEEVTRRVLDRLSDRAIRETVGSIVSSVAERLVREEIERIKASIK